MKKLYAMFLMLSCIIMANAEVVYQSDMTSWTKVNAGQGRNWFNWASYHGNDIEEMDDEFKQISGCDDGIVCEYDSNDAANAWAISPAIELKAGQEYTVSVYAVAFDSGLAESWKLTVATKGEVADLEEGTALIDMPEFGDTSMKAYSTTFSPEADGEYFFGMNCYSEADQFGVGATGFSISAEGSAGIAAVEAEQAAQARYFNLQGVEVKNPVAGELYIVKKGNKAYKAKF